MKKIWSRLLVLLVMVSLAAAAFAYLLHALENYEAPVKVPESEALPVATLPVVWSEVAEYRANVMRGYAAPHDLASAELPLVSALQSEITVQVALFGSEMAAVSYKVYDRGTSEIWTEGVFEDVDLGSDTAVCHTKLAKYLMVGVDYLMEIQVQMKSGKTAYYYSRVCEASELPMEPMVRYVMKFHEDTYYTAGAQSYAGKLESDENADTQTLADFNIRGSVNQLAWDDLHPVEVNGTMNCRILEMDTHFGSLVLEYEIEGGDPAERFLVKEYFSLRYTDQVFFLMNYRRTMTELFSENGTRMPDGALDLGVIKASEAGAVISEDDNCIAFAAGGEVWSWKKDSMTLTKIFSFRDEDDLLRTDCRETRVKPLRAEKNGSVSFLLYGYMSRGRHEGETGVAFMRYEGRSNVLEEQFFLPYNGTMDTLFRSVDTLSTVAADGRVYLMVGEDLYLIDSEKQEVELMASRVREKNFVVNEAQTVVAWTDAGTGGGGALVVLYLDTNDKQSMGVPSDERWIPEGFLEEDCVIGKGRVGTATEINGELTNLYYSVVIRNRDSKEEASYQFDGIGIYSVTVRPGQVELERVMSNGVGGFQVTSPDTIIQNTEIDRKGIVEYDTVLDDTRLNVLQIPDAYDPRDAENIRYNVPKGISYENSTVFAAEAVESGGDRTRYYAYAEGELIGVEETAGAAIDAAFSRMGAVLDSRGNFVWKRTTRVGQQELDLNLAMKGTSEQSRNQCLMMQAGQQNYMVNDSMIRADMPAMDALNTLMPGKAINLTGAPMKSILYYLDLGRPLTVIDPGGTAKLVVGYDLYNIRWYDPVTGDRSYMGQGDFTAYLETGCTVIGYVR